MPELKLLMIFLVASLVILSSCESKKGGGGQGGANQRQRGPMVVEGFFVETSSISEDVEVPGSLLPLEETKIRSEVSGRLS